MDPSASTRRTPRDLAVACAALLVLGALAGAVAAMPAGPDEGAGDRVEVVVGFHDRPAPDVVRDLGGTVTDAFDLVPAVAATVPASTVATLARHPRVAYVERDETVRFRDTARARGAGGRAVVTENATPWGVARIGAGAVHADGTDGNGVVVAVLDSGVDGDHPALADSYAGGIDLVDDRAEPRDTHGHGTYVAGIVAADPHRGGVGVAPGATVYDVKVLNETMQGNLSDVVAGIEWAVAGRDGETGTDDDADVILMSLGSFVGPEALRDAVEAAYEDHGVLVVAAAGNSGELDYPDTVTFPGRYEEVVSVGAVNRSGETPPWSSRGPRLELVAPGVDVRSTAPDAGYVRGDGTSGAAPHVAGAAALVLDSAVPPAADADGDGQWDAAEVRTRLRATARDRGRPGRDDEYGHGRVDAAAAVGDARPNSPPDVEVLAPEDGVVSGPVTVRVDASDAETMDARLSVFVSVDGNPVGEAEYNETAGVFELRVDAGTLVEGGRGEVTVTVTDGAGANASDSATVFPEGDDQTAVTP